MIGTIAIIMTAVFYTLSLLTLHFRLERLRRRLAEHEELLNTTYFELRAHRDGPALLRMTLEQCALIAAYLAQPGMLIGITQDGRAVLVHDDRFTRGEKNHEPQGAKPDGA